MKEKVQKKLQKYSTLNSGFSLKNHGVRLQLLGKSVLATLPVAGVVSVPTSDINSQIIHNSVAQTFNTTSATVNVNLGTLGIIEAYISSANSLYFNDNPNHEFVRAGNVNFLKNLASGVEVNATNATNPDTGKDRFCQTGATGEFCNGTTGYIGFEKSGKLGWMRVSIGSGGVELTVHEYAYNTTSGQPINTGQTALLPVELIDFNIVSKKKALNLTWQTASEVNNAGFELQRSSDGKNFQNIIFVEGKGNTNEQQEYSYADKELRSGQLYYYRLKQIDYDGRFEYSEVITAKLEGTATTGTFFPNPTATGQTVLSYPALEEGQLNLEVFDASGKQLLIQAHQVVKGENNLDLNFSDLGSGMFFVRMEQNGQSSYQKLILK